jgi:putative ABC transport system permease protein
MTPLHLLKLALRNAFRNRRRSLLTAGAVLFAVASGIFIRAWLNGLVDLLGRTAETNIGAVQVHRQGFLQAETEPLKLDLPLSPELEAKLLAIPGVLAVAPRITFEGLLANGVSSSLAQVTAIDIEREAVVCPYRWSAAHSQGLSDKPNSAAVGKALAEALGAKPGTTLNLLAATKGGASNVLDVEVDDLAGAATALDSKRIVVIPLAYAQTLLGMPGRITEYAVKVPRLEDARAVAQRIRDALGPGYSAEAYNEIVPALTDIMVIFDFLISIVLGVLLVLAGSGIANTMLMSVHERVREIGTMMAVGAARRRILRLFLAEAAVLGLAGGIAGAALSSALVGILFRTGIPFHLPGSDVVTTLKPWTTPAFVLGVLGVALLGAMASALYPAWKASRLTPVEALRSL